MLDGAKLMTRVDGASPQSEINFSHFMALVQAKYYQIYHRNSEKEYKEKYSEKANESQ